MAITDEKILILILIVLLVILAVCLFLIFYTKSKRREKREFEEKEERKRSEAAENRFGHGPRIPNSYHVGEETKTESKPDQDVLFIDVPPEKPAEETAEEAPEEKASGSRLYINMGGAGSSLVSAGQEDRRTGLEDVEDAIYVYRHNDALWKCPYCGAENEPERILCKVCGESRNAGTHSRFQ